MPIDDPRTEAIPANKDYGAPIPWDEGKSRLAGMASYWLTTIRPDGTSHVRPCLAVWLDGHIYTSSKETAVKGRNLARDSRCVLTAGSSQSKPLDMVVEGTASRVTDDVLLKRVAEAYDRNYGWKVEVKDGRFDAEYGAPTAGEPPFSVYQLVLDKVYAFPGVGSDPDDAGEKAPLTPTRWSF